VLNFFNLVVGGLVAGGLYAILASGVVLTYQTSGIFNFAYGAMAFATAFLFFELNTGLGWPTPVAAVVAIVLFAPALGWSLDRLLFSRLSNASITVKLVVPISLLVALPSVCLFIVAQINEWTSLNLPSQEQFLVIPGLGPNPKVTWDLNGLLIDSNELIVLGSAVLIAFGLWFFLRHSRLGLEMRAVVDRRELSQLRGINATRTSSVAWMIGSFLAGLAGVLLAPLFTLDPFTFTTVVLISTPAVVLARFRSLPVAILGGLMIGVIQNLVVGYAAFAQNIVGFDTAVPFILLYLLLFYFGGERGRTTDQVNLVAVPAVEPQTPLLRKFMAWGLGSTALLVYVFIFANGFWQNIIAQALALGVVLLSFTVLTGLGGMVSLAQATFVTSAGFAAGWAISHHWPFLLAVALGTCVATLVGVVVALPSRRLGGLPLALSTMAVAFVGQDLVFQINGISNGSTGWAVPPPSIGPLNLQDGRTMVVVLLIVLSLAVLLVRNLMKSSTGRAMRALCATESGAVTVGIGSAKTKVAAFALSAAIAGFGGVLMSMTNGSITNVDYPVEIGLLWLTAVVVVGIRRPAGAVLAGLSEPLSSALLGLVNVGTLLPSALFGLAGVNLAQTSDGVLGLIAMSRQKYSRGLRGSPRPTSGRARRRKGTDVNTRETIGGSALRLEGVRAGYGVIEVLHGIDLIVERGQCLALVGANGAGKTTLCSVVSGLVACTSGSVTVADTNVSNLPLHRRVNQGAFLVPDNRGVFPSLTVEENLEVWLRDQGKIEEVFARYELLANRRHLPARSLSGGEQQLLGLVPALLTPPVLLLADEPSLGLAPLMVAEVYRALAEIKATGTAILLVEEKANDVMALADVVAFVQAGHIVWTASSGEVDDDRLMSSYFGGAGVEASGPVEVERGGWA
jgi:branched-subunit amino acid ABC-type transport system permease component/ABC-type branched-subunit amino acid transport system ATPase component